jgi:hypothetical protein
MVCAMRGSSALNIINSAIVPMDAPHGVRVDIAPSTFEDSGRRHLALAVLSCIAQILKTGFLFLKSLRNYK